MWRIILFLSALISLVYEGAIAVVAFNGITSGEEGSQDLWGLVIIKTLNIIVCLFGMAYALS